MELFKDIYKFIATLSFIDIIFFIAILALLILIVTLIYFIKINKEVLDEDDFFPKTKDNDKKNTTSNENKENLSNNMNENSTQDSEQVPDLLGLSDEYDDEEGELLDLESLTKKLKSTENTDKVCTKYEQDQEEKAIISYDELLKRNNKYAINYEKEEVVDDLIIKKVNLHDLTNKNELVDKKDVVQVISYDKEEAFLNALKELNNLLN